MKKSASPTPGRAPVFAAEAPTPIDPRLVGDEHDFETVSSWHSQPLAYDLSTSYQPEPGMHVRISHVPPGAPAHVVVATSDVGGQLTSAQHFAVPMQRLPQTTSFTGQLHMPPGPEQVCVAILQSALVQHSALGMHMPFAVQNVCPVGQLHEPP